jgi:hypothetical protein
MILPIWDSDAARVACAALCLQSTTGGDKIFVDSSMTILGLDDGNNNSNHGIDGPKRVPS